MGIDKVNRAVFLDRDGVINEMIFDYNNNEYRPPHRIDEIRFIKGCFDSIRMLNEQEYLVFLISNQPDYAKGKTDLENINKVRDYIKNILDINNCNITEYYYCYHHPEGIIEGYNLKCECRKPGTLFVENAINQYSISRIFSYFIGDRTSDIICGKNSGLKTVYIQNNIYPLEDNIVPDFVSNDLYSAVKKII